MDGIQFIPTLLNFLASAHGRLPDVVPLDTLVGLVNFLDAQGLVHTEPGCAQLRLTAAGMKLQERMQRCRDAQQTAVWHWDGGDFEAQALPLDQG